MLYFFIKKKKKIAIRLHELYFTIIEDLKFNFSLEENLPTKIYKWRGAELFGKAK